MGNISLILVSGLFIFCTRSCFAVPPPPAWFLSFCPFQAPAVSLVKHSPCRLVHSPGFTHTQLFPRLRWVLSMPSCLEVNYLVTKGRWQQGLLVGHQGQKATHQHFLHFCWPMENTVKHSTTNGSDGFSLTNQDSANILDMTVVHSDIFCDFSF